MNRNALVIGNWKMNYGLADSKFFLDEFLSDFQQGSCHVALAPPLTSLETVSAILKSYPISLAAQNMHFAEQGAFTGEVSPLFLKELAVTYVLLGHSERRQYFGENDEELSKKIRAALHTGLKPVYCVGESLEIREANEEIPFIKGQISKGLQGFESGELGDLVIAYEPVWAIGTGKTASPEQAQAVHEAIRAFVAEKFGKQLADSLQILYGGSVKADNAAKLMEKQDIDGLLVGGASLKASEFLEIVRQA